MAQPHSQPPGPDPTNLSVTNHTESGAPPPPPPRNRGVPELLLNDTLRLFFLRAVVASSCVTAGFTVYAAATLGKGNTRSNLKWAVPGVVLTLLTFGHHLGTALGPRLFPLPAWTDICWTFFEAICYFAIVGYLTWFSDRIGAQWFPKYGIMALVAIWTLAFSVLILVLLKVMHLIARHDADTTSGSGSGNQGGAEERWWKHPFHSLFGRRMWGRSVPGESDWVPLLRGFLALFAVCALIAFGIYQAIIMPIVEVGKTPHRAYRTAGLDFATSMDTLTKNAAYNVILAFPRHQGATANLTSAATLTGRWRQRGAGPVQLQPPVACTLLRRSILGLPTRIWDVVVGFCPPSPTLQPGITNPWWDFPNFDVRVNFTELLGPGGAVASDRVNDAVRVYLGLTADVDKVYLSTEPVSLFPGANALSVANIVLLQTLQPAALGTFGFESYENYLVASTTQTISNPLAEISSDRNIGTLGFTLQSVQGGWVTLQDYRSKSVLSGLSALGGLGSLFSTILALLLGTSLVQAVFRVKPNNPFGFVHGTGRLKEAYQEYYPNLGGDIQRYRDRKGLPKYLLDTLIDIETLGYKENPAEGAGASGSGNGSGGSGGGGANGQKAEHDHDERESKSSGSGVKGE